MDRKARQATSPRNCKQSDTTKLHAHTHKSTSFSVKVHIVNILSFVGHIWYQLHTDFVNPFKNMKTICISQSVTATPNSLDWLIADPSLNNDPSW